MVAILQNGGFEGLVCGNTYALHLPYDGSPTLVAPDGDERAIIAAIAAAEAAAPAMAELCNGERSELLFKLHAILRRDGEKFAQAICTETGKPIKEARVEADRAAQTLFEAAIVARELAGTVVPMDAVAAGKGRMAMTVREPVGVIGAITPFNFPLNLAMHKIAPALAAGNTVVHKPAELTPYSAMRLRDAIEEAAFPRGAYNVVTGQDGEKLGQALVRDPRVAMITFTGSVPVGKAIRAAAGLKRVTLELGNNSAVIVDRGADLDLAASRCVQGAFAHSGQVCISVQRIYVHEYCYRTFLDRLVAGAQALRIGHPREDTTDISSLISVEEAQRVERWIAEALAAGAKVAMGGPRRHATIPPTVLTDVPMHARISCEEVFGPVVAVAPYSDVDDAIWALNATPYGLQAGIFTQDLELAFAAAKKIRTGGVMINDVPAFRLDHMPYGGVKESGIGREGPRYAVEEMTELKLICWRG